MPNSGRLREWLLNRFPAAWVDHQLASFQPEYFRAFDHEAVARHLELARALSDERPVVVHAEPDPHSGAWRVEVVGFDSFQFLSTLCTLLTVTGFSIVEAKVFTSEPPPAPVTVSKPRRAIAKRPGPPARGREPGAPDRRRRLIDVFLVRPIDPTAEQPDWSAFQNELATLTQLLRAGKYDEVHHRLIGRFVAALERYHRPVEATLEPIDLSIDSEASESVTEVRINARDSLGFLSLTASALALCGIRIVRAEIRTGPDGRIDDTIWVTDRSANKITGEPRLRELRLSLILIEHFSSRLPHATNPEAALKHFSRFATETMSRPDWAKEFAAIDRPEVLDALVRVLGESEFLWEDYLRDRPDTALPMIAEPSEWNRRRSESELTAELDAAIARSAGGEESKRAIQAFKDQEILRADLRSILGLCEGAAGFASELTAVAEVLIRAAFRLADAESQPPAPVRNDGRAAPSVLCALGKFGGRELGFASDLELMLVYDDRELGPDCGAVHGEHFDQLIRRLRDIIGARRNGTFELDFRLRPYGKGGPPATAWSTFNSYYQTGGPAWGYERQALIKLRVVAGDPGLGREIERHRERYVFGPEPFDLDGLKRMRQLQVKQLVRPGAINAKYSPGGLVEIEYAIQALQIIHGSNDMSLRSRNTLDALASLVAAGRLTSAEGDDLSAAYRFQRSLIDALRVVHGNARDLNVPPPGSEDHALLSRRLRATNEGELQATIKATLQRTRELVERILNTIDANQSPPA